MEPDHEYRVIPVTTDLGGAAIGVGLHEFTGGGGGPKLSVIAGLHGDEWMPAEVLRRLFGRISSFQLVGSLRAVPVANQTAFSMLTRNTPFEASDGADMNRIFPGRRGTINELTAAAIDREVLSGSDYVIDLHFGIWGSSWLSVDWPGDIPDTSLADRSRQLTYAYGCPLIYQQSLGTFPGTRSALWHAASQGTVPMAVELGGCGFSEEAEEEWIEMNVDGLVSVMREIGMLEGEPLRLDEYLHYKTFHRMEPGVGGHLHSNLKASDLGSPAAKGDVAGRVLHSTTFEELEVITAPTDGVWRQVARSYPVRPGGWGFAVADMTEDGAGWKAPY